MPIERKLAAIMFTDIAGYTALSAKDSTKSSKLLTTQRDTLKPIVEKHGGSWMKEMGDGLLLTFDSATSAVECSIAIQEATKDIEDLNLRIGLHEGEVIKQDGDVIGDDVNVASRIEPFSAVGGVAISQKVQQAISSNQDFETKYIGKPKLKGVAQEVKVYCITSHGLPETDVSKVSAKLEQESKFNIYALTGGILTAIGIAFWIAVGVFDVSLGGKTEVPSVGILMMENLGKEDEEFWSSGLTADLITKVAGAGLIRVAQLDDILKLDKDLTTEEKAKKLRVKYILTHSFLIKDDGFDLWCKLENTENGFALFSNKISEPMSMTTQMVGKLANDIITSLNVKTKQDVMKVPTTSSEAYEYYLKGRYRYRKQKNNEDILISKELLRKAIVIDENLIDAKIWLGKIYHNEGNQERALNIFEESLEKSRVLGDSIGVAGSLIGIGDVHFRLEEKDTAIKYWKQAIVIEDKIGDKRGIGRVKLCHCFHSNIFDNQDEVLRYYKQSLALAKELEDSISIAYNLEKIGYINRKNPDIALDYFNQALEILEEYGDKRGVAYLLPHLGFSYGEKGDHEKALDYYQRTANIAEEIGEKSVMSFNFFNIAEIYNLKGDYNTALDYLFRSLDIDQNLNNKWITGMTLSSIGNVYFNKGNYDEAIGYLDKSISIHKEIGYKGLELETTTDAYLSYKHLGKEYDVKEIHTLIKEAENIEYYLNYRLSQLLDDTSYLETAYNQINEQADAMEFKFKLKFLSYPIPAAIVEEWEKVTTDKN